MAKLIDAQSGKEIEVENGENIRKACEQFGVEFSCEEGSCGVCAIEVFEGEENLTELTHYETHHLKDKKHRLACQCKIKGGTVKVKEDF
jgi:ferredoxin